MHPPLVNRTCPTELFTRERRRQRMREFLETFDQQTWTSSPEMKHSLPIAVAECRGGAAVLAAPTEK